MPIRTIAARRVGPVQALAGRVSYAGELGWELYLRRDEAIEAWDALVDAGTAHGIRQVGYRAIESLRLEKGYRAYGTDLTASDTPDEAGLAMFVRPEKGPFIGREAIARAPRTPARRGACGPSSSGLTIDGSRCTAARPSSRASGAP